jgi:integrase
LQDHNQPTIDGHAFLEEHQLTSTFAIISSARCGETVFIVSANALSLAWERLRRRAGVSGLRFHDLRHEAVSRFFEKGLNVPEVAMISGHRDPRMLFRYTHPKAEEVAAKLST